MERRLSERKQIKQHLTLESPKTGRVTVIGRNISLGGLLVETGTVSLEPNTRVVVAFNLSGGDHEELFRLEALVIRSTPSDAALMFVRVALEDIRRLSDALSRLS